MNVEIGTETAQILFWEYINGIFVAVSRGSNSMRQISRCYTLGLYLYGLS